MTSKIIIIGAGPAGLLLAHYLSRRSKYQIDLYERRNESELRANGDRSFPISLQKRGRKAIRTIPGLEEAIAKESVFCQGTIVYPQRGKPKNIKRKNSILTIDRNRLVNVLLEQLPSSDKIQVHFGCECTDIDDIAKTVTLQLQEKESFTANYDLLIGADGAGSPVRKYLQTRGTIECDSHYIPDSYKSLYLERLNPDLGIELAPDRIHTSNIGNNIRAILVPQPENKLNGVIIFSGERNPFEGLSNKAEVLHFFSENFHFVAHLIPESEAESLLQRPVARVLTVSCDRFDDGDSMLIIGDAAHAVSPSIGQGCNSALEDVFILGGLIERYQDDWLQILPEFSQQRVKDARALRELSDYSFPRTKLLVIEFFLRLSLSRLLHKYFSRWFQPFVFDLVLDTDMPYSEILHLHRGWIEKVKLSMKEQS